MKTAPTPAPAFRCKAVIACFLACTVFPNLSAGASSKPTPTQIEGFVNSAKPRVGGPARLQLIPESARFHVGDSGYLRYVGAPPTHHFEIETPVPGQPHETARRFLKQHAPLFGVAGEATDFDHFKTNHRNNRHYVRLQQTFVGLAVLGSDLTVQVNEQDGVEAVLGKFEHDLSDLEDGTLSRTPKLTAADATILLRNGLAAKAAVDSVEFSPPRLVVFAPGLLSQPGRLRLTWEVVASSAQVSELNERILLDAHTGEIFLRIPLHYEVKNRQVHDAAGTFNDPGPLIRTEGSSASGITDVDQAFAFLGDTYDFYFARHGRDSINGQGMPLSATVRLCQDDRCPWPNATWWGGRMRFGSGFATDDITAHELTHGVTENESGLWYWNASGAINESFSDIWGEFVDLSNVSGIDSASVRWLLAEDLGIGAIRNMRDPTAKGDPDRLGSPLYIRPVASPTDDNDYGGVHSNSGINNKLCYLLTDGDSFNGQTVRGMGIPQVASLYYEVNANLLGSTADWVDLYNALRQAAINLGWNGADRTNLQQACVAVEIASPDPTGSTYDLSRDFSLAGNPNGVWSYGSAGSLGMFSLLTQSRHHSAGFDIWEHPSAAPSFQRNTATTTYVNGGGGVYPPGSLTMSAASENSGINYCVARLTIPIGASGSYLLETTVQSPYPGPPGGDTDFHVLHNGVELFGRFLTTTENAAYTNTLILNGGDRIDFVLGRGSDGREFGSQLRIHATVSLGTTNPPSITTQPTNHTVIKGNSASFSVGAAGSGPLGYQWRFNDGNIPGATQATLSLVNVQFSQAGGYSVVVSNSVGSVTSTVATLTVTPPPVPVRLVSVNGLAGAEVQVPIAITATGNENALAFSLQFDPALLQFVGVNTGSGVPAGSTLLVNSAMAATGKVGVAVALAPATTFSAGTQQVALARFTVASVSNPVSIPITFGDVPTTRQLSDSQAQTLPVSFQPGTVTVSASTVRVVNTTAVSDGIATVRVQLVAQGNENAVAFSLNFNSNVLAYASVSAGANVPTNGTLLLNNSGAAQGRVGVAIALPAETAFAAGTQEVAVFQFDVAPVLVGSQVPLTFGDLPLTRQLSDGQARPLPATFAPGNLTIVEVQFEGDVAPRPNGNRLVSIVDYVQMGRFVAALDTITSPSEFQRVDCAPRDTRGNGLVTVSDLVQAGRYTVGLDPLTPTAGPDAETGGGGGGGFLPASESGLGVADTTMTQGQISDVPITLKACGLENALSFSVTYDATKLGFLGVLNGPGATSASLIINSNQMSLGRIGVVLALPPGQTLSAGMQQVLRVRFAAASSPTTEFGNHTVGFGNQPVPRETSDAAARALPTTYTGGTVIVVSAAGPALSMTRSGNLLFITWPGRPGGFNLESASHVAGGTWTPVSGVVDLGAQKLAVVMIEGDRRYFRLKQP